MHGCYGRIDVVDYNVGLAHVGGVVELPEEEWDRVFAVNLDARHPNPLRTAGFFRGRIFLVPLCAIGIAAFITEPMVKGAGAENAV